MSEKDPQFNYLNQNLGSDRNILQTRWKSNHDMKT